MNCLDSPTEIFVVAWLAFTLLGRILKAAKRRAPTEPAEEAPAPGSPEASGTPKGEGDEVPHQIPEAMRRWLESIGIDVGGAVDDEPGSRPSTARPPAGAESEAATARELVTDEAVGEGADREGADGEASDGEPEPVWSDRDLGSEETREWTEFPESELALAAGPRDEAGASEAEIFGETGAFETGELAPSTTAALGPAPARTVVAVAPAPSSRASLATLVRDALVLESIFTPRRQPAPPPAGRGYGR